MKAAIVEKPNVLGVRDVPVPQRGEYDALCELLYGATCTGTDLHLIGGRFPFGAEYPTILGHESIGRIVRVGSKVRNLNVGDLVTRVGTPPVGGCHVNWGGFAEFGIARDHWAMKQDGLPRDQWNDYRVNQVLPPGMNPAEATMIITWRETFSYMNRLGISSEDRVLILGSGGNGLSFVAHAKNLGVAFVAVAGSTNREAQARKIGADAYVDYKNADPKRDLAGVCPDGFTLIIDSVGKTGQVDRVLPCLNPGGKIGIYGVEDYFTYTLSPHQSKGTFTFCNMGYDEEESHARVVEFIQTGKLHAQDFVDLNRIFPLDEITHAFEALKNRQVLKAVIKLS